MKLTRLALTRSPWLRLTAAVAEVVDGGVVGWKKEAVLQTAGERRNTSASDRSLRSGSKKVAARQDFSTA